MQNADSMRSDRLQETRRNVCAAASPPETITLQVNGTDVRTMCVRGEQCDNGAVIMLSDICGNDGDDTLAVAGKLADAAVTTVFIPDLFQETPWPRGTPSGELPTYRDA